MGITGRLEVGDEYYFVGKKGIVYIILKKGRPGLGLFDLGYNRKRVNGFVWCGAGLVIGLLGLGGFL